MHSGGASYEGQQRLSHGRARPHPNVRAWQEQTTFTEEIGTENIFTQEAKGPSTDF